MPPQDTVILVDHDPDWPQMAASHAGRLKVLGPILVAVHHIGSTSIEGLAAKPIIDLMPMVTSFAELDQKRSQVEALGYEWCGEFGIPGRRYCRLTDSTSVRLVHLHFFESDSPQVQRYLALRNYLRTHPDVAGAYEQEKRCAGQLHPNDTRAYTKEKSAWIQKVEAEALAWYRLQRAPHA